MLRVPGFGFWVLVLVLGIRDLGFINHLQRIFVEERDRCDKDDDTPFSVHGAVRPTVVLGIHFQCTARISSVELRFQES